MTQDAKYRTHEILDAAIARGDKTTLLACELLQIQNCKDGLLSLIAQGPGFSTMLEAMIYDRAMAKAMANIAHLYHDSPEEIMAAMKLLGDTCTADAADLKAGKINLA